jgi:hypothetical protein
MSYYAKVENGKVMQVIAAKQDVIDSGLFGTGWVQTSYNTKGNVHYGQDGQPDGGIALRGNFAGIGYTYDAINDVFYAPKPYPSWLMNESTWLWKAPIPFPTTGGPYQWDETNQQWVSIS